ncbi:uncharacterized protein LOC126828220 isoform X2 [Patella vulgata]|uniref:uncharacterized protein LOC126828220 isoform X2 n=1 Tax=Patella vulgata TaxID=6465 RepID=UPI00217F5CFB|nr:uncharacterized protein LOC126828220 isoform X2 [Patella vulgata]
MFFEMSTVPQWAPKILMTPEKDGLFVEFAPPFKSADYYRICVMDPKKWCVGGNQRLNYTANKLFVPSVPRNHTYDVMVRPFKASGDYLDDWISQRYFYPPDVTGSTEGPISEASSVEQLPIADNTQTIVIAVGLCILALIVVTLLYIVLRKEWVFKRPCIEFQEECVALRSEEVEITPIYIPEQPFICAVKHHLDLLEKIDGITIKETPLPSTTGENNHQNIHAWIDYQIRSFNAIKNKQILIYVSSRLLNSLDPSISRNEGCDTICNEFINRLAEKLRDGGKRPFIVCFGDVTPYTTALTQSLAMSRFNDLRSVVQCDNQRLNIDGTYSLIRDLTNESCDHLFTTEELGEFRRKVSILLNQTTNSENVPYADPDQTIINCNGYSPINHVAVNCNGRVPQNESTQYCDGRLFSNCNGATSGYRTNDTTSPDSVLLSMEESNGVEETFIAPSSINDSCGNITEAFENINQRSCWLSEQC